MQALKSVSNKFTPAAMILSLLAGIIVPAALGQDKGRDEVQAVILLMRHGVRAPISHETRAGAYNAQPWPRWPVAAGVLTHHGAEALHLLGAYYRSRYASLLRERPCSRSAVYAEASNLERTIASAKAVLSALAPGCSIPVHFDQGGGNPVFSSGDQRVDQATLAAAIHGKMGNRPDWFTHAFAEPLEAMHRVLMDCTGANCDRTKPDFRDFVVESGRTSKRTAQDESPVALAADFAENFLLEYTEGMPMAQVGWGRVSRARLDELMAMNTRYHDFVLRTPYWARIGASDMAERIAVTLQALAEGKELPGQFGGAQTRLVLLDGSDSHLTWLGGLLRLNWLLPDQTFNATPPGSGLVFELHKNSRTGESQIEVFFLSQTLDQIRYLQPLTGSRKPSISPVFVPGCSETEPPYPCSLAEFAKVVSQATDKQP